MDDLERQLMNFDNMGTSIEKIRNPGAENKELFRDLNTFQKEGGSTCGNTMAGKNFDMNNFVQDLENNLDNFDNVDEQFGPKPSNIDGDFGKKKETFVENLVSIEEGDSESDSEEEKKKESSLFDYDTWNEVMYDFLIKIKEPLIIVLLFILLNNRDFITLTYQLPFMNLSDSPYPSLIIRGMLLAVIIYYLRKMDKK